MAATEKVPMRITSYLRKSLKIERQKKKKKKLQNSGNTTMNDGVEGRKK
jgi:hypothetical protein